MGGFQFHNPFDARSVEPSAGFELMPAGDYTVRVVESEAKATNANDGSGKLELKLEIIEGQYAGRLLFYNLNLFNKNPQSSEIAYRQLSALCHVTGVFAIQNSQQLHGIPFKVTINNDGTYNNVKVVKFLNGETPGKNKTVGAASPAPVAAAPPTQQGWAAPAPAAAPPASYGPPATGYGPPPPNYAPAPAAAPAYAPPAAPPQNGWAPPNTAPAPSAPAAQPWQPAAPNAAPPAAQPPWVR
jgi:hypothetical protein